MRYLITVDCNRIYMDIGSLNFRGDFLPPAFVRTDYFDYKNAMSACILSKMRFKCACQSDIPREISSQQNQERQWDREREREKRKRKRVREGDRPFN